MGIQLIFFLPFISEEVLSSTPYNDCSKVSSGCAGVSELHYCSMVQIVSITLYLLNKRWWIVTPQEGGVITR